MHKYSKTISSTLALLYLLICSTYIYNLYLGAEGVDIHNYLRKIEIVLKTYGIDQTFDRTNIFFYNFIAFINIFLKFENSNLVYIFILSVNTFLLSYKFFSYAIDLKISLIGFFFILLILFTPKVMDLIISNIRGGLAFVIYLYAIKLNSKIFKSSLILLSALIHFMVLPILSLYILYYLLKKTGILRKSNALSILLLFICCFIGVYIMKFFHSVGGYRTDVLYSLLTFFITIYFLIISKALLKNEEGFVAMGLLFTILVSFIVDYHTIRYLGVVFIMYGFSIININSINFLKYNTIFYFLLFSIYHYFFYKTYIL